MAGLSSDDVLALLTVRYDAVSARSVLELLLDGARLTPAAHYDGAALGRLADALETRRNQRVEYVVYKLREAAGSAPVPVSTPAAPKTEPKVAVSAAAPASKVEDAPPVAQEEPAEEASHEHRRAKRTKKSDEA